MKLKSSIIILFILSILLSSFSQRSDFEIKALLKGVPDYSKVYLEKVNHETMNRYVIDSTIVMDQSFKFIYNEQEIDLAYITIEGIDDEIPMIYGKGDLFLFYDQMDKSKTSIKGTLYNEELNEFNQGYEEMLQELEALRLVNIETFQQAVEKNDNEKITELNNEYQAMSVLKNSYVNEYLKSNPQSIVTLLIIKYNAFRDLRSQKKEKSNYLSYYESLTDALKQTIIAQKLMEYVNSMSDSKIIIGERAQNFSAKTPEGKYIQLNEVLGKVTIVDFWASWCKPCRDENPTLVSLYHKYSNRGLRILGVSVDKNEKNWKDAIKMDKLDWNHVIVEKSRDYVTRAYEISTIPSTFILDEKGAVIAKDLRGDSLKEFLEKLLD